MCICLCVCVCVQGFRCDDMRAWRQHWNHQLYKALEHQYQMGLEALNKNLPEIHIDLTFKSVNILLFGFTLWFFLHVIIFSLLYNQTFSLILNQYRQLLTFFAYFSFSHLLTLQSLFYGRSSATNKGNAPFSF